MMLDRLEVDQLRIIESAAVDLQPGINLFTGPNGAGKTTLLEAVHALVRGKSFRRGGLESQIRHAAEATTVRGRFNLGGEPLRLDFMKRRGESIEMRRDRRPIGRLSELLSLIPIQTFLPDLAELVFGSPFERRRWLDLGLFYDNDDSLRTMAHFRHVLRQRNAALRMRQLSQLDAWDFELAASADAVTSLRQKCFDNMATEVVASAVQLCPELSLSLRFFPGHAGENFASDLAKQRSRDVQLRMTNSGPHRADIRIRVSVEGTQRKTKSSAATAVSQGQARALASAFKLGQVQFLKSRGFDSLLLVDDLGSEWDNAHCERFLTQVTQLGTQVISSAVSANQIPDTWRSKVAIYELDAGKVVSVPA